MNIMDQTIIGATSGETAFADTEGFTISGKRTEDNEMIIQIIVVTEIGDQFQSFFISIFK